MEGGLTPEAVTAAVLAAGFVAVVLLLVYAIRRARKARQRQIDEAGEGGPILPRKPKRAELRADDVVPEETPEAGAQKAFPSAELPRADGPAQGPSPAPESPALEHKPAPEIIRQDAAKAIAAKPVLAEASRPALRPLPVSPPKVSLSIEKPRASEPPQRPKSRDTAALAPGLARTRASWVSRLGQLFVSKRELDPALIEEIEKVLLTADIGVNTSQKFLQEIRSSLGKRELTDPQAVWGYLRKRCIDFLHVEAPAVEFARAKPFVLLTIGVNGSGKTTTIGKLASKLKADGKSVLLAAGDTFRAAATEQLEVWGSRVGAPVVRGKEGSDPSSVIFDSIRRASNEGVDVVIADTAGRLHTKANLMDELQKVKRVAGKALEGAPHETWLVIDATSGQNAIAQAQTFTQAMAVSGIVLTKLDGTAKGGVILGITDQLGIPVRYIGVGERVEDLREFDAEEFVEALFEGVQGA
jgi:fused signal recognition particle receptor